MSEAEHGAVWVDLDEPSILQNLQDSISLLKCRNFVVEFTPTKARCAVDLNRDGIYETLESEVCKPDKASMRRSYLISSSIAQFY